MSVIEEELLKSGARRLGGWPSSTDGSALVERAMVTW